MELVHFRSVSFCGFHIVDVVVVVDRVWPNFFSASRQIDSNNGKPSFRHLERSAEATIIGSTPKQIRSRLQKINSKTKYCNDRNKKMKTGSGSSARSFEGAEKPNENFGVKE